MPPGGHVDRRSGHVCAVVEDDDGQREAVRSFVAEGLRTGRQVLGIAQAASTRSVLEEQRLPGGEAAAARPGQFRVRTSNSAYVKGGSFDPDRMLALFAEEAERALSEGFSGLWVTADVTWAARALPGVDRLIDYERAVTEVLRASRSAALCLYDRRRLGDDLLAEAWAAHSQTPERVPPTRPDMFRVLTVGPGRLRLSGELDARETHTLQDAIDTLVGDGADSIEIDLSALAFSDAAGLGALCRPAVTGQARMHLRGTQPAITRTLSLLALDRLPAVRVTR
jgi:anti-anti-sigma factor